MLCVVLVVNVGPWFVEFLVIRLAAGLVLIVWLWLVWVGVVA